MRWKSFKNNHLRLASTALFLVLACSGDDGPPTTPSGPALDAFEVAIDDRLVAGRHTSLEVTAIASDGSSPFAGFAGTVTLSVSEGTITPDAVTLDAGRIETTVAVDGTFGPDVVLTLTAGTVTSTATLPPVLLATLPGNPDDDAVAAIPTFEVIPEETDYRTDHPDLPGAPVSPSLLLLSPTPGTTVAELDALLDTHDALVTGGLPGVLVLRIPTEDHATTADLIATLEADPRVAAVAPDIVLGTTEIPETGGQTAPDWTWEAIPGSGNWGLERIRVPAMWNLNASIAKRGVRTRVGVIDAGFTTVHADLDMEHHGFLRSSDHGTHVAGTVGATHDNQGIGVDGINPFATLVTMSPSFAGSFGGVSLGQGMSGALVEMILADTPVRVINMSLAYNWYQYDLDPSTSVVAQAIAAAQGDLLAIALDAMSVVTSLPLISVAAGNEGSAASVPEARYSSPMAAAALIHGVEDIVVVENVANSPGTGDGDVTRSFSSCVGGHLSAPGEDILSTISPSAYGTKTGTSMASPHVAGLAGYLAALDPSLTNAQLRQLLLSNRKSAGGGASDRIDAWAAAVEIDGLVGGDAVLRALVDIDDGTLDGNQRVDYLTGADLLATDVDGDGGDGDGVVDMADFRRWRDWLLQVSGDPEVSLDGSASHPKKDLNRDHDVGTIADESLYPRGDFNGDGVISLAASSLYPGALDREVTDLEVMQEVFDDPDHDASELPGLIESGDLTIDGSLLIALPDAASVRVEVSEVVGGAVVATRDLVAGSPTVVITVPASVDGYDIAVEARDASFVAILEDTLTVPVAKGQDHFWRPGPEPVLFVEITAPESVPVDEDFPVVVRAGTEDASGTRTYLPGVSVDLDLTGGSILPGSGTTDANGDLEATGSLDVTTTVATLFATASLAGYDDITASATVVASDAIPDVFLVSRRSAGLASTNVSLRGSGDNPTISEAESTEDVIEDVSVDVSTFIYAAHSSGNTMYGTQVLDGTADAIVSHTVTIHRAAGRLVGWDGTSFASSTAAAEGVHSFGFDDTWATSWGTERLTLNVSSETRLLLTIDPVEATGGGGNRSGWVLRSSGGGGDPIVSLIAPAEGAEIDVLVPPGSYVLSMSAITVIDVSPACGCTSGAGTASVSWTARFVRP